MAASAWRVYNEAKKYMLTADLDLNAATMRIKLVKATASANVVNYALSTFASITGLPANTSIKALTSPIVTALNGSATIKFDATDMVFTASGGDATSVKYAVIGISGGKALAWCLLTATPIAITSGNTLTIAFNANGIFTLSGGTT